MDQRMPFMGPRNPPSSQFTAPCIVNQYYNYGPPPQPQVNQHQPKSGPYPGWNGPQQRQQASPFYPQTEPLPEWNQSWQHQASPFHAQGEYYRGWNHTWQYQATLSQTQIELYPVRTSNQPREHQASPFNAQSESWHPAANQSCYPPSRADQSGWYSSNFGNQSTFPPTQECKANQASRAERKASDRSRCLDTRLAQPADYIFIVPRDLSNIPSTQRRSESSIPPIESECTSELTVSPCGRAFTVDSGNLEHLSQAERVHRQPSINAAAVGNGNEQHHKLPSLDGRSRPDVRSRSPADTRAALSAVSAKKPSKTEVQDSQSAILCPFEGTNRYSGQTFALLSKTLLRSAHQTLLLPDFNEMVCGISTDTTEIAAVVFLDKYKHWSAIHVSINYEEWKIMYFDPIKDWRVKTWQKIRSRYLGLFRGWARELGWPVPYFSWSLEESIEQSDGDSCGTFVWHFVECSLKRKSMTQADPKLLRQRHKEAVIRFAAQDPAQFHDIRSSQDDRISSTFHMKGWARIPTSAKDLHCGAHAIRASINARWGTKDVSFDEVLHAILKQISDPDRNKLGDFQSDTFDVYQLAWAARDLGYELSVVTQEDVGFLITTPLDQSTRSPDIVDLKIFNVERNHWEGLRRVTAPDSEDSLASSVLDSGLQNAQVLESEYPVRIAKILPNLAESASLRAKQPRPTATNAAVSKIWQPTKKQQIMTKYLPQSNIQPPPDLGRSKHTPQSSPRRSPKRRKISNQKPSGQKSTSSSGCKWTEDELRHVERYRRKGRTFRQIGKLLGRTAEAVRKKLGSWVADFEYEDSDADSSASNNTDSVDGDQKKHRRRGSDDDSDDGEGPSLGRDQRSTRPGNIGTSTGDNNDAQERAES
ncbi:MAG: hypothetical protein Q9225_004231, partial [Loekoesia sp. 1 TL-2023]